MGNPWTPKRGDLIEPAPRDLISLFMGDPVPEIALAAAPTIEPSAETIEAEISAAIRSAMAD